MIRKLSANVKKVFVIVLAAAILMMNMELYYVRADAGESNYVEAEASGEENISGGEEDPEDDGEETLQETGSSSDQTEALQETGGSSDQTETLQETGSGSDQTETQAEDDNNEDLQIRDEGEDINVQDGGAGSIVSDEMSAAFEAVGDLKPEAASCICGDACMLEEIEENCPVCAKAMELDGDEEKYGYLKDKCLPLMELPAKQAEESNEEASADGGITAAGIQEETVVTVTEAAETEAAETEGTETGSAAAAEEEIPDVAGTEQSRTVVAGENSGTGERAEGTVTAEENESTEEAGTVEAQEGIDETEKKEESKRYDEDEALTEAETGTQVRAGADADEKPVIETVTESEPETETGAGTEIRAEIETETETETETESETETGIETETESETETGIETETEAETETETESETETETGTEAGTESETETEEEEVILSGSVEQRASRWIFSRKVNMSYTVVVENQAENAAAKDVEVMAVFPSIITIEGGSDGVDIDGQTVTWAVDEIDAGKKVKLTLSGYINENTDSVENLNGRFYINGGKIEDVSFSGEWRLVEASRKEGPTSISTVCDGVTINVSAADNSVLPPGTQVRAARVSDEAVIEAIENSGEVVVKDLKAFDVSLLVDGREVQPDGSVVVTFSDIAIDTDDGIVEVAHVADGGNVESMGSGSSSEASVETTHFSVYVLYSVDINKTNVIKAAYESAGNMTTTVNGQTVSLAAFDFHIFAKTVTSNVHINGNIAANEFGLGHDFGNAGKFEVSGNDVVYLGYPMQNINTIKADYAVLGAFTKIVSYDNHSVTIICPKLDANGNVCRENGAVVYRNERYTLQITPEKCFIADEETVFLDIEKELENVAVYSGELGNLQSTAEVNFVNPEHTQRYELTVPVQQKGNDVVLNITWEQFRTYVDRDGLVITTNGARCVVINVDMTDAPSDAVLGKSTVRVDGRNNGEQNASYNTNVIWNFVGYEDGVVKPFDGTLTLNGDYWNGTIMAPKATVNFGAVNGSVIASEANHINQESHKSDVDLGGSSEFAVEKIWNDGLESHPEIEVTLYVKERDADGRLNGKSHQVEADKDGNEIINPITFEAGAADYVYTFENLSQKDEYGFDNVYFVKETKVPDGYTSYVNGGVIANTLNNSEVSLKITKVWVNAENSDRIQTLTFHVYRKINGGERELIGTVNRQLQNSGESYTVRSGQDGMPKLWKYDAQRNEYIYEIEEVKVNGYSVSTASYKNGNEYIYEFINTRITDSGCIDIKKTDGGGNHLAGAVFGVYLDPGCNQKAGELLTDVNGYARSDGLPVGLYYVKEISAPAGYTKTDELFTVEVKKNETVSVNGGIPVVNNPEAQEIDPVFSVKKTVIGSPLTDSTFTFRLYENSIADQNLIDTKTITGSGSTDFVSRKFTQAGNYIYKIVEEQGNEEGYIYDESVYTVTVQIADNAGKLESSVKYTKDSDAAVYDAAEFVNRYEPAKISRTAAKVWKDNDDQDGMRPESVSIQLMADGSEYGSAVVLNDGNDWSYTWYDLPEKKDGRAVKYEVEEVGEVKGYTTAYSADTFTVTNIHQPETVEVNGCKTWNDGGDQDGIRPGEITVNLLADGKVIESRNVTAKDDWSWNFTNLPKYSAGRKIEYTITEDAVKGYDAVVAGFNIENKHVPETVSRTVIKVWDDSGDQDGLRPESVTVQLKANGRSLGDPVVLNAESGWTHTWNNLDRMRNGQEVKYEVEEVGEVAGYTAGYSTDADVVTITNSHRAELLDINGHKTWDDSDNRDGLRPAGIVVNLFADGVRIDSRTVTEADDWSWCFTGLPRYEDGAEISYTIGERTVNGYESIVNGYNITNRLIPETTETEETESTETEETQETESAETEETQETESTGTEETQETESTGTEETQETESAGTEETQETESTGTEETQETESAETEETQETESIETGDEESESASETESVSKNTEETIASGEPSDEDDHENPDGYNPAEDNHTGVLGAIRGGTQGVLGAMRGVLGARIRTGDDSLIMAAVYVVFLAVAVAGIAAVAIRRKRAKKE